MQTAISRAIRFPAVLAWKPWAWRETPTFEWCFILLGGLPFVLPFLFLVGESHLAQREPVYWYYWMNACISAPHVYATYCRLTRKIRDTRVSWWWGWPGYGCWIGLLALASVKGWYLNALTAVNVWQSFHYVRQVYGVSRIYAAHDAEDPTARIWSFYAFHLAMPLFVLGRWHTLYTVWGGKPSEAIIPVHVSSGVLELCWVLCGAGLLLGILAESRKYLQSRDGYNPVGGVNLAVYFAIFLIGFLSVRCYQRGFFAVTIYHAIQYLGLVWKLEHQHARGVLQRVAHTMPAWMGFVIFWMALFVSGFLLEHTVFSPGNQTWPTLATIGLAAMSAHHYTVDTVMWRSRVGS